MQLGVMYMLSFRAYLYLTVLELLLFTVLDAALHYVDL